MAEPPGSAVDPPGEGGDSSSSLSSISSYRFYPSTALADEAREREEKAAKEQERDDAARKAIEDQQEKEGTKDSQPQSVQKRSSSRLSTGLPLDFDDNKPDDQDSGDGGGEQLTSGTTNSDAQLVSAGSQMNRTLSASTLDVDTGDGGGEQLTSGTTNSDAQLVSADSQKGLTLSASTLDVDTGDGGGKQLTSGTTNSDAQLVSADSQKGLTLSASTLDINSGHGGGEQLTSGTTNSDAQLVSAGSQMNRTLSASTLDVDTGDGGGEQLTSGTTNSDAQLVSADSQKGLTLSASTLDVDTGDGGGKQLTSGTTNSDAQLVSTDSQKGLTLSASTLDIDSGHGGGEQLTSGTTNSVAQLVSAGSQMNRTLSASTLDVDTGDGGGKQLTSGTTNSDAQLVSADSQKDLNADVETKSDESGSDDELDTTQSLKSQSESDTDDNEKGGGGTGDGGSSIGGGGNAGAGGIGERKRSAAADHPVNRGPAPKRCNATYQRNYQSGASESRDPKREISPHLSAGFRRIPLWQKTPEKLTDSDPISDHPGASMNDGCFTDGMKVTLKVGDEAFFCCGGRFDWLGNISKIEGEGETSRIYGDFSHCSGFKPAWNIHGYPRDKVVKAFKQQNTSDLDSCLVRGHALSKILSSRNSLKKGMLLRLCDSSLARIVYNDPICWRLGVTIGEKMLLSAERTVLRITYLQVKEIEPHPRLSRPTVRNRAPKVYLKKVQQTPPAHQQPQTDDESDELTSAPPTKSLKLSVTKKRAVGGDAGRIESDSDSYQHDSESYPIPTVTMPDSAQKQNVVRVTLVSERSSGQSVDKMAPTASSIFSKHMVEGDSVTTRSQESAPKLQTTSHDQCDTKGSIEAAVDDVDMAKVEPMQPFFELDAQKLDFSQRLSLPAYKVSAVKSYLMKPKQAQVSSTLASDVLAPLLGAGMSSCPPSPIPLEGEGNTNDAMDFLNKTILEDGADEDPIEYCPYEVVFVPKTGCGWLMVDFSTAQKIYLNNPFMRCSIGDRSGMEGLRLTVGSLSWATSDFSKIDLSYLRDMAEAAKVAGDRSPTAVGRLGIFLETIMKEFYSTFPMPVQFAEKPNGSKITSKHRLCDLHLDQPSPFREFVKLGIGSFCWEKVDQGDVQRKIGDVMQQFLSQNRGAVRYARSKLETKSGSI